MRTKQQFEKHKEVSGSSGSKSELERYLAEDIEPDSDDFDILKWWKVNEPRFPILAEMNGFMINYIRLAFGAYGTKHATRAKM
ncbi:hypothetical protein KY290_033622 [Solanum tuberosum]|uniref:HAT C-terminal dimerisation domain-containing protein n=1 Tax=Solanum tuberosum TaxID=4113 RepID=A0ABQ7U1W9_SOLTU|nr:hypothetical protein KY290_033622 [Solanum tuberosum]